MSLTAATVEVPVRDGEAVVHATVDAADAKRLPDRRWRVNNGGYAVRNRRLGGQREAILMHREILGLSCGDGLEVDHRNRSRLDNRRANLRIVTTAENRQNVSSLGGTSRFRGVAWLRRERKWQAKVQLGGRTHWLGCFDDEIAAAYAAEAFRLEHMPCAAPDPELQALAPC